MAASVKQQVLLYALDNREVRAKAAAKHLGVSKNNINTANYQLRKSGLLESAGYGRMVLTEKGRQEVKTLLTPPPTLPSPVPAPIRDEINWQQEYIKLALEMARSLGRK